MVHRATQAHLLLASRNGSFKHLRVLAVHLVMKGLPASSGTCWRSASVTFLVPFASRWNLHECPGKQQAPNVHIRDWDKTWPGIQAAPAEHAVQLLLGEATIFPAAGLAHALSIRLPRPSLTPR